MSSRFATTSDRDPQSRSGIEVVHLLECAPVFFEGKPVIPLDLVDQIHERPNGSARRTFNKKRKHFTEGEDYVKIPPEIYNRLIRTSGRDCESRPDRQRTVSVPVTAVTERGYTLVIKPFGDDHSWGIQKRLAKTYFAAKEVAVQARIAVKQAEQRAAIAEEAARDAKETSLALRRAMLALLDREERRSKREASHAASTLASRKGDLRAQRIARNEIQPFWDPRDLPGQEQFALGEGGRLALPGDAIVSDCDVGGLLTEEAPFTLEVKGHTGPSVTTDPEAAS